MLEAPVAFPERGDEEHVAIHRGRLAPEPDVRLAQSPQVALEPRQVGVLATGERDLVRHAARREPSERERAHLDRMVDQLLVAGGRVRAEAVPRRPLAPHRGRHAPPAIARPPRRDDLDFARRGVMADDAQEDAGAVEEPMRGVEVRAAHRGIPRIHLGGHGERPVAGVGTPRVLVELAQPHRPAPVPGADRDDVAGKLAHHVAAGNPRGQDEALAGGIRRIDGDAHLEEMRLGRARENAVADRARGHQHGTRAPAINGPPA